MKNQKKNWRQLCINVLQNGPSGPDETNVAAALIGAGYADGAVRRNNQVAGNVIANLHWRGATLKGLEYADQLQDKLTRETVAYKMKQWAFRGLAFVTGYFFETAANLFL